MSICKSAMIMANVLNESETESVFLPTKSTIYPQHQLNHTEIAEGNKLTYCPTKSVVDWDDKLLPDMSSKETLVDRLSVLLSLLIDRATKLLSVPALDSGIGPASANAMYRHLQLWKSSVIGMCFDIIASNTGKFTGACKFLEESIGQKLLWLTCRHHMLEVLLSDVFTRCFEPSSGPEILVFKTFREKWTIVCFPQSVE